jgi:hypothetical protein
MNAAIAPATLVKQRGGRYAGERFRFEVRPRGQRSRHADVFQSSHHA